MGSHRVRRDWVTNTFAVTHGLMVTLSPDTSTESLSRDALAAVQTAPNPFCKVLGSLMRRSCACPTPCDCCYDKVTPRGARGDVAPDPRSLLSVKASNPQLHVAPRRGQPDVRVSSAPSCVTWPRSTCDEPSSVLIFCPISYNPTSRHLHQAARPSPGNPLINHAQEYSWVALHIFTLL